MAFLGGLLGNMGSYEAPGTGLLGKLGTNLRGDNPLWNYAMAYASQLGPSLTPTSPLQRIGTAGLLASEAQQNAMQNELIRAKLAEHTQQTKAQEDLLSFITAAGDEELVAGIPNKVLAAGLRVDPTAFSKLVPQTMTAEDQLQLLETKATIEKLIQERGGVAAETTTPAGETARAIGTLADVFDVAEKGDNPFAPGRMFYKDAPLGKLGLTADAVLGLPDVVLRQWGDPATVRQQAEAAQLIDKETATISRGLGRLAQKGTGKSATAIDQMQTSLGEGNVSIPVRRKVIASTLETVIDDLETKGLTVPDEWYDLRDRLLEQTKNVGKTVPAAQGTQGYDPQQGLVPQPPTTTTTSPQEGVPELGAGEGLPLGQRVQDFFGGIFGAAPPGAEAAPSYLAPPAPTPRKAGTLRYSPQGVPTFNRFADVKRAEAQGLLRGVTSIEVGGKTYDWVP